MIAGELLEYLETKRRSKSKYPSIERLECGLGKEGHGCIRTLGRFYSETNQSYSETGVLKLQRGIWKLNSCIWKLGWLYSVTGGLYLETGRLYSELVFGNYISIFRNW